jgi:hypothetical protein
MKKTRQQDRAKTKVRMAAKKARLLKLCVQEGKTVREASRILKAEGFAVGASKTRVGADLQALQKDFEKIVPQEREKAYNRLNKWVDELETDPNLRNHERIREAANIYDRLERLLGLSAPNKNLNVNVGGPSLTPEYIEIARAMADVAPEDRHKVLEFARSLVRPLELTADCFPPEAE